MKLPRPSMYAYPKSHQISEGCHFTEAVCAILSLQWWRSWEVCPGPKWGWMQGQYPQKSAEFLLHMLKNAECNDELNGLDVDALVTEQSR